MKFGFVRSSRNKKTGPIPVVTASKDTCPSTCPLMNAGCYAEHGPLRLVWDRVSLDITQLCREIKKLPKKQLWRYGQAGDLPPDSETLDKLTEANNNRPVLCYSHNRDFNHLRRAKSAGFNVNISADSPAEADLFADEGLPIVTVLPSRYARKRTKDGWGETLTEYKIRTKTYEKTTPRGLPIAVCPATYHDVTCDQCGICVTDRKNRTVVGFPAHGTRMKLIDKKLEYGDEPGPGVSALASA